MVQLKFFRSEIAEFEEALKRAAKVRGFEINENGVPVHIIGTNAGLDISGKESYSIAYSAKNELFRAIAILVGKLEADEKVIEIHQESKFKMCGVMLDCSRNAVPKLETLADLFARIALMGLNTAMLYTEDTYEVDGYKYFGYMRGKYTKNELRELDRIASEFGIELIPCIQTLAHLATTMRWEYTFDMTDMNDILLIGEQKTYDFIEAMISSVRECFSTNRIHIGMDEAHNVGRGKYLDKHGYRNRFELLCEHVTKVCEIADKYNFKPMMWSDMFFRIGSDTGDYYCKDAKIPEWLPDKIPQQISMVYWDYYHTDAEMYDCMLTGHKQLRREIIFAGGIWKWSGMTPAYGITFDATIPALSSCIKSGVQNVFATMWGDDGGEISNYTALLGMQLFAEFAFEDEFNINSLYKYFKYCTGYDAEAFLALSCGEAEPFDSDKVIGGGTGVSRQVLYQDILCGLFDKNLERFNLEDFYSHSYEKLNGVTVPDGLEYLFEYNKSLLRVLKLKCSVGIKIRRAYGNADKADMQKCVDTLDALLEAVIELHGRAYLMWHTENKAFGFDRFDIRLSGVEGRIRTAKRRIQEWIDGKVPFVEELEEELLWYGSEKSEGKIAYDYSYKDIASASV